jgi:hypothetical protein
LDRERPSEDVSERRAGKWTRRTVDELRRIAADQTGLGAEVACEAAFYRALHNVERAFQDVANFTDGSTLIFGLGLERQSREWDAAGFSVAYCSG